MNHKTAQARRRAVLTDAQVRQMRAEHIPYIVGYETLARKFGCSTSTARDICTYRTRVALLAKERPASAVTDPARDSTKEGDSMERILPQRHTVLRRGSDFLVVYPTPGLEFVPTVALICRTEEQANSEASRLNGGEQ
jgi:AraC-like DNA-binding protein